MGKIFSVSDEQLKNILDNYSTWLEKDDKEKLYPEEQKQRVIELKKTLLNKRYLEETSNKDMVEKVIEYSRTLEGPAYIKLGVPRVTNEINNIKNNLIYLIDSKDDPFRKAANVIEGKYKIQYF